MTNFFRVPTKICENILFNTLKGICEKPWRNDTNSPKQWKHNITKFTFIHLENSAQTKTMFCLFQKKTCTINFLNKSYVTFQIKYHSDKKLYFSCARSARLMLLHYSWQRFYIGFISCDLQRYTWTTSFIGQATPITRLNKVHIREQRFTSICRWKHGE